MRGIDEEKVGAWLADNIDGVAAPFTFELIAGGRSNLTFRATDANGVELVVRRPPLGHVLATAHDMAREHRLIAAVGRTDVPVPPALGLCEDESVNGAPFYVMGFVDGAACDVWRARDGRGGARRAHRDAGGEPHRATPWLQVVRGLAARRPLTVYPLAPGVLPRRDGCDGGESKQSARWWPNSKPLL